MQKPGPARRIWAALLLTGLLAGAAANSPASTQPWPSRVDPLLEQGKFIEAARLLTEAVAEPGLSPEQRTELKFELDRIGRIRKDYTLSENDLFGQLRKRVKNVTEKEFQAWIQEGRFDVRSIEGQKRFMNSSVSNLFFRYPELSPRRIDAEDPLPYETSVYNACAAIKEAALKEGTPYVLPKTFEVTMRVTVHAGATFSNELVRAWLPIPRDYPFQGDFELRSRPDSLKNVAPHDSPIRSVYLEQPAQRGEKLAFELKYAYRTHGVYFPLDPAVVLNETQQLASVAAFTREAPHSEFTPEIRALASSLAGSETNALLKAKRFYNWISENIKYSFATEYSTVRNLSEYCCTHSYGDCGQEALLFMALCRISGIPARWQSGWSTFPGAKTIHDWTEIYLARYGWVPVDPYMGIFAMRYAMRIDPEKRTAIRDFYFGGLDQYRLIANSDHCQPLSPPKSGLRSDTVDFQRGEVEAGGRNIYFDQYSYDLKVKELKTKKDRPE